jgi:RNA polymerase sigma-70 factor (ECF subfamily)
MEFKVVERNAPPQKRSDSFQVTRWSLVAALASGSPEDARRSLVELCQGYWYPVYAYVRRCGHEPKVAYDIAQAFFSSLLVEIRGAEPRSYGQFRTFLLDRLNRFLSRDWRSERVLDPSAIPPPVELVVLEQRHQRENTAGATPEAVFQRSFALEVLARSSTRLRLEAEQGGRLAMFERLEPFLTVDPQPGEYERLAQELRSRPLALVMAVKRLRSRFRELVEEELAQTVADAGELAKEREALLAVLAS